MVEIEQWYNDQAFKYVRSRVWIDKQKGIRKAKEHNFVGQQLPTLLDVTCVRFRTLLHVVVCFWELVSKV